MTNVATTLNTIFASLGRKLRMDDQVATSGVLPARGHGTVTQSEIEDLFELYGGSVYLKEEALRESERLERATMSMIRGAMYKAD